MMKLKEIIAKLAMLNRDRSNAVTKQAYYENIIRAIDEEKIISIMGLNNLPLPKDDLPSFKKFIVERIDACKFTTFELEAEIEKLNSLEFKTEKGGDNASTKDNGNGSGKGQKK